jgi:hypothetical protein
VAEVPLQAVYRLDVEEPGEGVFTPGAIVVSSVDGSFTLFCARSVHNRYRRVLSKYRWTDLLDGLRSGDAEYRLVDFTAEMRRRGWLEPATVPAILDYFLSANPTQYHFLEAYRTERTT